MGVDARQAGRVKAGHRGINVNVQFSHRVAPRALRVKSEQQTFISPTLKNGGLNGYAESSKGIADSQPRISQLRG
jgi:hypothetical protein